MNTMSFFQFRSEQTGSGSSIVGKGGVIRLFSKIPPFLEIQDALTFHRSIKKTKVLNNSCKQFVYHFYPQSILVLEKMFTKVVQCKPDITLLNVF